jgi:adenylate cyclase class 2
MPGYKEIEVRFLEIDKAALIAKLHNLGAHDEGEEMLEEIIFDNAERTWQAEGKKFVRIRTGKRGTSVAYKNHSASAIDGVEEVELRVDDAAVAEVFLTRVGLVACRRNQKLRHTFKLGDVTLDIDTWPRIPTYVELEGPSENALKLAAAQLGLDWKNVCHDNARIVIEGRYGIPVGKMTWFTFDRFE